MGWPTTSPKSPPQADALPEVIRESGLFLVCEVGLQTDECKQLRSKDKRRLLSFIAEATWALSWMHGEFNRAPSAA